MSSFLYDIFVLQCILFLSCELDVVEVIILLSVPSLFFIYILKSLLYVLFWQIAILRGVL